MADGTSELRLRFVVAWKVLMQVNDD